MFLLIYSLDYPDFDYSSGGFVRVFQFLCKLRVFWEQEAVTISLEYSLVGHQSRTI